MPSDIAVTGDGDLVYTDDVTKTVNIVKNKQIREVINLEGWETFKVRVTFNGDMLVTMDRIGWRIKNCPLFFVQRLVWFQRKTDHSI